VPIAEQAKTTVKNAINIWANQLGIGVSDRCLSLLAHISRIGGKTPDAAIIPKEANQIAPTKELYPRM